MSVSDWIAIGMAIVTIIVVPAAGLWAKTIRSDIEKSKTELRGDLKLLSVRLRAVGSRVRLLERDKEKAYNILTASINALGSGIQTQIAQMNDRVNEHAETQSQHSTEIKNHSDEIANLRKSQHDLRNQVQNIALYAYSEKRTKDPSTPQGS